jgi:hypothetical protein
MLTKIKIIKICFKTICFILVLELLVQLGVWVHIIPYFHPLDNAYYNFNLVPYFSKPCCAQDTISGFRWLNTEAQVLKICRGKIVFRQTIHANNAGFISPSNFEPQKRDSTVFRWLIFGDSFTDGYFLSNNWPSAVTEILQSRNISSIELHSFALNGSGIKTWSRIFEWLNKNNYEYDGIILACFGNDLSRDYFVMQHQNEYCFYGWSDSLYPNVYASLQKEKKIVDFPSAAKPDELLAGRQTNTTAQLLLPYYFHLLYTDIKQNLLLKSQAGDLYKKHILPDNKQLPDNKYLQYKYGKERYGMLQNLLALCRQKNKRIILASVPEEKGVGYTKAGGAIQLNRELIFLAAQYHALFFDGYKVFAKTREKELYLPYDGHWNQQGSDLFARQIAVTIIDSAKM